MRIVFISLAICFMGCHPDKNKLVDVDTLRFQSTDASEIYFRNLRRSYYQVEENKEAAVDLYTLSDYQNFPHTILKPTIAYNWRNDFVAIMLNRSDELKKEENLVLVFQNPEGQEKMIFNEADIKTQTMVAIRLYNGILNKSEISLVRNRQKELLFENQEEKELFRITIFDFLRFVEMR